MNKADLATDEQAATARATCAALRPEATALDATRGASFPLWANSYWNTNYPGWFPFDDSAQIHQNYSWRFAIEF